MLWFSQRVTTTQANVLSTSQETLFECNSVKRFLKGANPYQQTRKWHTRNLTSGFETQSLCRGTEIALVFFGLRKHDPKPQCLRNFPVIRKNV